MDAWKGRDYGELQVQVSRFRMRRRPFELRIPQCRPTTSGSINEPLGASGLQYLRGAVSGQDRERMRAEFCDFHLEACGEGAERNFLIKAGAQAVTPGKDMGAGRSGGIDR